MFYFFTQLPPQCHFQVHFSLSPCHINLVTPGQHLVCESRLSSGENKCYLLHFVIYQPSPKSLDFTMHHVSATEDGSVACGICLLNVDKSTGTSKQADGKLMYGGRQYHSACANFWCNRVDSVLPSLLPIDSLI